MTSTSLRLMFTRLQHTPLVSAGFDAPGAERVAGNYDALVEYSRVRMAHRVIGRMALGVDGVVA